MLLKKDLETKGDGYRISGLAVIQNIEERATRNGTSSYLCGNLQCKGTVPYKVWYNSPCYGDLKNNMGVYVGVVCEIIGKVNIYEGNMSVIIECCRLPESTDGYDVVDFFDSKYNAVHMWDSIVDVITKNCSANALKVFNLVIGDYKEDFMNEYAAISHHDNCKSGLIGHTAKVVKMVNLLKMYPDLMSRCGGPDVMYVGCAIHDIGKVLEYKNGAITNEGLYLSHMVMGAMLLEKYKGQIIELMGTNYFYSVVSIVSSHAGEYGERPRTVASYVSHLFDSLEATLTSINDMSCNTKQLFYDGYKLT